MKECVDEFLWIEVAEVVDSLSNADKANRNSKLVGKTDEDTTFCSAVEFGEDETGHTDDLVESLRDVHCLLACC